jgi:pimeloyl-ACP methyl ester carboxylesterase
VTDGIARVGTNGLQLHYQEWGPARAEAAHTAVLVHGVGSSSHIWDLTAPLLVERYGLRVVALDQRGHGESEQPSSGYDFPSVVADLAGFMDEVGVTDPALVVGHSWGASVVLHFADEHPDRVAGLVLVDGGTNAAGERWTWEEAERRLTPPDIDGMLWADLRERQQRNNPAFADPRTEALARSLWAVDAEGRIARRFKIPNHMQVVRALWEQRPFELFGRLQAPLLVLPARRSTDQPEMLANKVAGVERVQAIHASTRVRWFEETIHDIPIQRPEELADELGAFAASVFPLAAASA